MAGLPMTTELWIGLGLTVVAGTMAGNCMLPSKFVRRWSWENMWLVFTLVSLVVAPWFLTALTVRNLGALYSALPPSAFAAPFLFGFGWGIAQVLFGLSIARLGLALGYSIIIGLGALLGTLVPLLVQRPEVLGSARGALILCGVAVMLAGIAVAGGAGRLRELASGANQKNSTSVYGTALLIAILCGIMAPMINFSLAFGQDIAAEAVRQGTAPANAAYAVWPVALTGGLIPNLAYSLYLLSKNRTWSKFRTALPDAWFPILMGVLWMGAVAVYGMAAVFLGALGTSVGWGLFQIFMIMTANLSGILTGEWKEAQPRARALLWAGLCLLAAATVIMALGNR
jgi:L-rhamnose-H+ transport protein